MRLPPLALQITLLGIGLVFAAILALGLLMAALVRLTAPRRGPIPSAPPLPAGATPQAQAPAVAVATALAAQTPGPSPFPFLPTALVSAWQAVRRAAQLNRRGFVR